MAGEKILGLILASANVGHSKLLLGWGEWYVDTAGKPPQQYFPYGFSAFQFPSDIPGLPPLCRGGEKSVSVVADNDSGLTDKRQRADGEVCQSRLQSNCPQIQPC